MKLTIQTKISLVALILINMAALGGVLFFGWNSADLLLAYWIESLVVGFYNILKMNKARTPSIFINGSVNGKKIKQTKTALIIFFTIHYGGFMLVHLFFLIFFIGFGVGNLEFSESLSKTLLNVLIFGIGLLISHGISYKTNFINNEEYKKTSASTLFYTPYKRILIMHLTIVIGAIIMTPAIFLILLKTTIDIFSHLLERKRFNKK
jgi:hypothetical protein